MILSGLRDARRMHQKIKASLSAAVARVARVMDVKILLPIVSSICDLLIIFWSTILTIFSVKNNLH